MVTKLFQKRLDKIADDLKERGINDEPYVDKNIELLKQDRWYAIITNFKFAVQIHVNVLGFYKEVRVKNKEDFWAHLYKGA